MPRTPRLASLMLAAALTSGCPAPTTPSTGGGGTSKASMKASPRPGVLTPGNQPPAALQPGQIPPLGSLGDTAPAPQPGTPPVVVPGPGGNLIANNGGALVGVVRVPAQLIANHGAGVIANNGGAIIANNGGTVITNNGGSYRLLALQQLPIQGVRVEVLDATGLPLVIDGKPVATETGPDGRYAFTQALPARNLVVRVVLPKTAGELRAIAPPDATARQGTDLDLVSTLATSYILEKYVRGQADEQATLDKLPATVEAETRAATALAVASAAAPPADLKPATAVATVDTLRKADASLDAQLEKVRALLIAAGMIDLGAGQPALSVALAPVEQVASLADGRLFLSCPRDRRIWTLDGQSRLQVALGKGLGGADPQPAGKPGAEVSIAPPVAIAADGTGLLVLEPTRLLRLGADGKVEVRASGFARARALVARPDGRQLIVTAAQTTIKRVDKKFVTQVVTPAQVVAVPAGGGAAAIVHSFSEADTLRLRNLIMAAPGEAGAIWLGVRGGRPRDAMVPDAAAAGYTAVLALDPTSWALTEVARLDATRSALAFDQAGRLLARAPGAEQLTALRGGGAAVPLGPDAYTRDFMPVAPLPGGAHAWAQGGLVFKSAAGQPRGAIAGLASPPREGRATELSFGELAVLGAGRDGAIAFIDPEARRLWRVDPSGFARTLCDLPDAWPSEDDFEIAPTHLGPTADGGVWLRDEGGWEPRLIRVAPTGALSLAAVLAEGETFDDLAVLPDGGAALLVSMVGEDLETVIRLVKPDGTRGAQVTVPGDETDLDIAAGPEGWVYVAGDMSLRRWKAGGTWETVATEEAWADAGVYWQGSMAVGPDGKLFGVDVDGIGRFDPATGTYKIVVATEADMGGTLEAPSFDGAGNLFVLDAEYRQVKRIAAGSF